MISKRLRLSIIFLILFYNLSFCETYFVRVGILDDVKSFELDTYQKNFILIKSLSEKISTFRLKEKTKIYLIENNEIKILNKTYILPVRISSEGKLKVNNNTYPGEIEIFSSDNKTLTVVNILNIETYLYGVLPYEIDTNWTDEMLKVQSIIARTYTLANFGRHKEDGYDLCSSIHCQVYKGISEKMQLRVKKAVDSTQGLVIVNGNEHPVQAYYHATCGGEKTENVVDVWQGVKDFKYLSGVKCNYCKDSPYYRWKYQVSQGKILKLLKERKIDFGDKIKSIKIISFTKNNRAKELEISSDQSSIKIKAEELRKILGYNNLKSTKIDKVEVSSDNINFYGYGWGHGVGLCQWGANYMSKKNYKFDSIIKYYYPHTKIKKLY